MWNRGGFRSSALERAKAQLSGQRISSIGTAKDTARRDLGSANFGKSQHQARHTPFHDLEDLSSEDAKSEDHDYHYSPTKVAPHSAEQLDRFGLGGGSRFLKKSGRSATADIELSAANRTPADASDFIPQRRSQSVALSRLALIEDRLKNRISKKTVPDTGTDFSLPQESSLSVQSSSDLSIAGSRFLKKKVATRMDQNDHDSTPVESYKAPQRVASRLKKSIDSDEEDMRRLLGESLNSPDGSLTKVLRQSPQMTAKTYIKSHEKVSSQSVLSADKRKETLSVSSVFTAQRHKSPSPSPPLVPRVLSPSRPGSQRGGVTLLTLSSGSGHSEIKSLEELFPVTSKDDDTLSEKSAISDDFQLNFMTLDDLVPATLTLAELPKEKTKQSPGELNPSSTEEISHEGRDVPEEAPAEYESDFESEIQTETAKSAHESISEHFSDGDKHSSIATDPLSHAGSSYTDDDYTLSEEPSKSSRFHHSRSESSISHNRSSRSSTYSSDATITQSKTQSPSTRRPVKDATVQTQRDGLSYTWSSGQAVLGPAVGMSYVDPTPVASHTISAEAVEALSAYSPAVFALNDMLRQQLFLTRSFIESHRHLHQTMMESLGPADYRYTTLEETKEFIRSNRSPKLTMEAALEEVLQEMREYHYI